MKTSGFTPVLALFSLLAAIFLGFPILQAAPGDLDSPKFAIAGGSVLTAVPQPDGKILIGGSFTTVQGKPRNRIARLKANGALDAAFNPNADGTVESIVVQRDGKILIGGFFTTLQPGAKGPLITRRYIARLEANGRPDASFDPNADREVLTMALQSDGKIVIGGRFSTLQPNGAATPSIRTRIARLLPDGSLEAAFSPDVAGDIYTLALQPDGKVLVAGNFTRIGSKNGGGNARLNANGTVDTGFTSAQPDTTNSIAVQPDGKILIGGFGFGIARLNPNGTRDTAFRPNANNRVYSMAVQADGKILIAGSFTQLQPEGTPSPVARNRIARLLPDGTVDAGFNPNANADVGCVALQADGKILVGGSFTALGSVGTARAGFARLLNDPATQGLSVPTTNQVAWTRGGSSPEFAHVSFELSTTKGKTWTPLGSGQRVANSPHWQITGITLPAAGRIRARGVTGDGNGSHGGLVESVLDYKRLTARPEIAVFTGAGTVPTDEWLNDASPRSFASTPVAASSAVQTFTIKNTGMVDLTGIALSLSGSAPGDFIVEAPSTTTLAAGETAIFTVAFTPTVTGERQAVVNLASSDADENPFRIRVQGTGLLSQEAGLSALSLDAGTLDPAFAAETTNYSVDLPNLNGTLKVTPTSAESNASITVRVNGGTYAAVASGSSSEPLMLNAGMNDVEIQVTAQDGTTKKIYHLAVFREGAVEGSLDPLHADVGGSVFATVVQPDGKMILAGSFQSVQGQPRSHIARLNPDGTLDTGFDPRADSFISCLAIQADGKVLLGGSFTTLQPNGAATATERRHIARLNPDGTLDTGFHPNPNDFVQAIAVQADGKILLGGGFTIFQPGDPGSLVPRDRCARLHPNGNVDFGFVANVNDDVSSLAIQADGQVLIGGSFTAFQPAGQAATVTRNRIARVSSFGVLDTGFNPGANGVVLAVALQADGKVLIGGSFTTLQPNGVSPAIARSRIARVNGDGTVDLGFDPKADRNVLSMAVQADGKVLLGGEFTRLQPNGTAVATPRNHVARVNADGTLDHDFDPNADNYVAGVALQVDGKVLLGGNFNWLRPNGARESLARNHFARLLNPTATESLTSPAAGRIEWLRGGTSPEVGQVTFELSTDRGASYTPLGAGTRIDGGWQWTGASFPNGQVRARGRTTGGYGNGSGGLVEKVAGIGVAAAPEIAVSGNLMTIANGDATPALGDHTDFGDVTLSGAGSTLTRTFTIANTGTADLTVGGITLSGPAAADFSVIRQPGSPVGSSRSTTFAITFAPTVTGPRDAVVSFVSNDADEASFSFSLRGNGFISSNANLSAIGLSAGTLAPEFSAGATTYAVELAHGHSSFTVAATKADANATLAVRYQGSDYLEVASGSASDALALDVGTNTLEIRVTAQDGTTVKIYTVDIVRAAAGPGDLDPLDAAVSGSLVDAVAVQPDGKTILAGRFDSVLGTPRANIARLNADGTLDAGFDPKTNNLVSCVAIQADGKILLGGQFTTLQPNGAGNATTRNYIARVNADGTLDTGFNPNANGSVTCLLPQADGKVLLGGQFSAFQPGGAPAATTRNHIARLNPDGTPDAGFDPNPNSYVLALALEADGKILLGGFFTTLRPAGAAVATTRNRIARVNADGTLDTGFNPNSNGPVYSLAWQADGKVLLGGSFFNLRPNSAPVPVTRRYMARVNADGTLDAGFNPDPDGAVESMALQADGKVLLGGNFVTIRPNGVGSAVSRGFVARVNGDGTLDPGFDPAANGRVLGIALGADGRVLLGGEFTQFLPGRVGQPSLRSRFARLLDQPANQSLTAPDANRIQWTRGGSLPDVSQVTCDLSTDGGSHYTPLGNATRVAGTSNWQLTGLSLPATGQIRARGRTTGGNSSGIVETVETVATFSGLVSPLGSWRQTHFGSPANEGNGSDHFDFDHDGLVNLVEYAFGLDPLKNSAGQLPQPRTMGANFGYEFTPPAGSIGVTHGAEWSDDLNFWQAIPDTGSGGQRVFSVPRAGETKLFLRLTVTSP
jgi:uncharacterized delta-60 repeat protein